LLRITGIKEPVIWITDEKDNTPIAWMAGIGIEGLVPDEFRGYKFRYTRELISPNGQIVDSAILSQAPGYMSTSTTVGVGGKGLPPGNYTVRIRANNGEEDTIMLVVPDYEAWLATKLEREKKNSSSNSQDTPAQQQKSVPKKNNNFKFISEVYLEEIGDTLSLIVVRKDETKYSVVLRDPEEMNYINHIPLDGPTISIVKKALETWGSRASNFAEQYVKDARQEIEFFNDVITLSKCLSNLPSTFLNILDFGEATVLLHNRIMTQIIYEYYSLGFKISLTPTKHTGRKIHDFETRGYNSVYNCEVKTIQSIGEIEPRPLGGFRLTQKSHDSLVSAIRTDLEDAEKVGENGIVIISPWSYRINALLRKYFEKQLLLFPPIPCTYTTILVLTSNNVFQDYYVSFPSKYALTQHENAFSNIQLYGISTLVQTPIREGLTIRMTTAPKAGSSVGYRFRLP
jgi:hypothetical protein